MILAACRIPQAVGHSWPPARRAADLTERHWGRFSAIGRLDEAEAAVQRCPDPSPEGLSGRRQLADVLSRRGEPLPALACVEHETNEERRLGRCAHACHARGSNAAADAALSERTHELGTASADVVDVFAYRGQELKLPLDEEPA